MAEADGYENKLDEIRRAHHGWHFRIGVHHLRGLIGADEAGGQYAELAEAVIRALQPVVMEEFSRRHGPPPGKGAVVLGMGSLGAGRLHARSDLDLIVIYDPDGQEGSDGPRPLMTRPYYSRLTQALVTGLTAPTAQGKLYEVDMRLRPSGRQGPVATGLEAFRSYQRGEAWTWEHLALTRARTIAGADDLAAETEALRVTLLSEKGAPEKVLPDVADMRARLAKAKPATAEMEAKLGPGGMQDIELAAEAGALIAGCPDTSVSGQIDASVGMGWLTKVDAGALQSCHDLMWRVRAGAMLLSERQLDPRKIGEGGRAFLLRETGCADLQALKARMKEETERADAVITKALGRNPAGGTA